MKPEDLIAFEDDIAAAFNAGQIRAPVHLYSGNEEQMIEIFKGIRPQDWVFCSWRSHYQCLLKGVPPAELRKAIFDGRSIALCFAEQRIYSSAIVGGVLPIAVGTALAIKRSGEDARVFAFMGDMTAETGIAHECMKYARNHELPIKFIIEDNGVSTCTDTSEAWAQPTSSFSYECEWGPDYVFYYRYKSKYPHSGAGVRVQF